MEPGKRTFLIPALALCIYTPSRLSSDISFRPRNAFVPTRFTLSMYISIPHARVPHGRHRASVNFCTTEVNHTTQNSMLCDVGHYFRTHTKATNFLFLANQVFQFAFSFSKCIAYPVRCSHEVVEWLTGQHRNNSNVAATPTCGLPTLF